MDAKERDAIEGYHELRGLDQYLTSDRREEEPDIQREAEFERERRWWEFEVACKEFAASERDGYSAVLRVVARAMNDQTELLPPADPRRI